LHYSPF